jgi:hypothetical protein
MSQRVDLSEPGTYDSGRSTTLSESRLVNRLGMPLTRTLTAVGFLLSSHSFGLSV